MNRRTMQIAIGMFVLVSLGILGSLIILFGSLPSFFKQRDFYTVRFTEAPGISPGTPVRRAGVKIGEVNSVVLDEDRGIVRVRIAIDPRYTLRRSENPTLVVGFLGDASIDFLPRRPEPGQEPNRIPYEPGAELIGFQGASVTTLLTRASEVVPTTQETLAEIRKSIQRLERLTPLAEQTLREYRDLARDARREIPAIRQTNTQYRELAREIRGAIPEVRKTNDEIQKLTVEVRKSIPNLRATSDDIGAAARNWGRVGERVDVLLQDNEKKIVQVLDQLNETLRRIVLILDEDNQRNLAVLLRNLRSASERLPTITDNAQDITTQGRKTIRQINDALTEVDKILKDVQPTTKELAKRGDKIVSNIDEGIQNINKATKPLAERGPEILENLDTSLKSVRKTLDPISGRTESIARNLDQALERFNQIVGDVRALLRAIDQSDGTLRRFLTDPSLYNRFDQTACMIQKLIPRLDRILRDVETFADKIARHPESLGVGGAIRPSTGLKKPPTPPRFYHHP